MGKSPGRGTYNMYFNLLIGAFRLWAHYRIHRFSVDEFFLDKHDVADCVDKLLSFAMRFPF